MTDILVRQSERPGRSRPRFSGRLFWLLLLGGAFSWSLWQAGLLQGATLLNRGGWTQFARFWRAAVRPELSLDFLWLTLDAMLVTLAYAVLATAFSVLCGFFLGLFSSELWWAAVWPRQAGRARAVYRLIRALLAIPRGIHELIWGLIFLNILGLDPLVAILAIGIPYSATIAKVFSEMLDETPQAPYRVLAGSGVLPLNAILYGLLPEAMPNLISYGFYRLECSIRAAAVLGVVGAGGLGYQILLSMQTLNYNETWTFFYALMLLSGLADLWSARIRQRLGRNDIACHGLGNPDSHAVPLPEQDRFLRRSLWGIALLIPFAHWYVSPSWSLLWSERSAMLWRDLVDRSLPLTVNGEDLINLWDLSLITLAMSILAALLAWGGGGLLAFPAARSIFEPGGLFGSEADRGWARLWRSVLPFTMRAVFLLMRAIPAPIWALMLLFIFFPGVLPGALALAIYNMGVLGRLLAEVVENEDKRPSEAIKAGGAPPISLFLYGLFPSVSSRFIAYGLYRWEINIRETVVVGLVGAGGLGRALAQDLSAFDYRGVLAILICLIILTFFVDLISSWVRPQLR